MTRFEGHPLHPGEAVPLFIAPGVLKDGPQLEPFTEIEDPLVVPLLFSGGWTWPEWPGNATSENPVDFVYYPDRQLAGNARGLPCTGIEGLRALKEPIKRLTDKGIKTVIQVTNLPHEKPLDIIPDLVEEAVEVKPTAVEVNLSCPNGLKPDGSLEEPTCNNPEASGEVMEVSRNRVGPEVTFGAKDSSHATSLESGVNVVAARQLLTAIKRYCDFVSGINTIGNQPFPEIKCAGGRGGASGPAVAAIAKEWLRIAVEVMGEDVPVLSCGGVDTNNAHIETPERLEMGAMRVGGAQEFFRGRPEIVAARWAQAYAESKT